MKKGIFILGTVGLAIGFSACSGGYTCPTYMQKETKTTEVLVKVEHNTSVEKI